MIVFANRNQIHPRRAAALLLFCGFAAVTWAQDEALVRGTVFAPTDEPVAGARVEADGRPSVLTGEDGSFELSLPPGTAELTVSHPAYRRLRRRIEVPAEPIELRLDWVASVEESVTVVGIRAGDDVPVTKRNMDREEIEKLSYGQDVPELLELHAFDELVFGFRYRRQLFLLQHARDPANADQHDLRRRSLG